MRMLAFGRACKERSSNLCRRGRGLAECRSVGVSPWYERAIDLDNDKVLLACTTMVATTPGY